VDTTAIGVLAALIHCHGMCLDRVPQVYNSEYIFEKLLPYANSLLREGEKVPLVELGIDFLGITSERLYLQSNKALGRTVFWESQRLNETAYQELFLYLIMVMMYMKKQQLRQLALGLFARYLGYFEPTGQMTVIRLVYYVFDCYDKEKEAPEGRKTIEWYFANKGMCGYLVDYYRGQLNCELSKSNFESPFFRDLPRMLALFTTLQNREETDLLDNYDRYVASLNLVRFLCMVRLNGRYTSLPVAVFDRLSKNFVEPMRKGLEISKAHYELDLKNCTDNQCAKLQTNFGNIDAVMADAGKVNVLKSAINSFDLMMSLVARVSELLELCSKVE